LLGLAFAQCGGVQSRMQWMCGHFFCNNFHIVHLTICIVIWKETGVGLCDAVQEKNVDCAVGDEEGLGGK
jgi:hypothetical protein